jgi:hypothetical protein
MAAAFGIVTPDLMWRSRRSSTPLNGQNYTGTGPANKGVILQTALIDR